MKVPQYGKNHHLIHKLSVMQEEGVRESAD